MSHFRYLDSAEPVRRYLELKAEIKEKTAELKAMEDEIWNAVDAEGGSADAYGFHLEACISRTYTYSPAVDALAAELSALRAKERRDGTAQIDRATGYVRVSEDRAADVGDDGTPMIDLDALAAEAALSDEERQPVRPF